jgi:hypothetical protein
MRSLSLVLVLLFFSCKSNFSKFEFENLLKEKRIEYNLTDEKYFYPTINACNLSDCISSEKVISNSTFYLYNKGKLKAIVHKINFINDEIVIDKAFSKLEGYASGRRNLKRKDYGSSCFDSFNLQFYFVIRNENSLYLIGNGDENIIFDSGEQSVDNILKKNELFFYTMYKEMLN